MKHLPTDCLDIYQLANNERAAPGVNLGANVTLQSQIVHRVSGHFRTWWIAGDFGIIVWPQLLGNECLSACEEFLARAGFVAQGPLPPDCFNYSRPVAANPIAGV